MSVANSIKSFDKISISYEIDPSPHKKRYLVFLHGLGSDLTAWKSERETLRNLGFPTLALDLRGHGLSGRPDNESAYELGNFVKDVLSVLEKEGIEKPVLVGHCFGGMVAIALEGTYSKTSRALILVDTSYKPPYFGKKLAHNVLINKIVSIFANHVPNIGRAGHVDYKKFIGTWDYDPKRILADILHTSLRSYLLTCEQILGFDATSLLKRISVPTLVVEGTNDIIFPPHVASELHKRIKTSEVDFIPSANHILVLNNPGDL
ncbi:MAG: alpha/beta fold hydrolase, partial [Candidatus Levybacteria bacterium]|nr:alpha/beta fold hydrolase [Candidatus Levybacteria bacterium]